jgi:hypothetical protein
MLKVNATAVLVKRKRSSEKQCADFAQEQHL